MLELAVLLIASTTSVGIGLFILLQRINSYTNRFFFLLTLTSTLWGIVNYFSLRQTTPLDTLNWVRWVIFFAILYALSVFLTASTFPSAKLTLKHYQLILLALASSVVLALTRTPFVFKDISGVGRSAHLIPGPGIGAFASLTGFFVIGSVFILVQKYRQSKGNERQQMQYLLLGIIISALLTFITSFVLVNIFQNASLVFLGPFYNLLFIAIIAYAIVAHHLFDIRVIIRRTVIYSGLLGFAITTYSLILFLFTALFGGQREITVSSFAPSLVAALFIALGFGPINRWLQDRTESFLFKKEYEEQVVLKELAKKLNDVVALDEALETMMQTLVKVLHLKHAVTYVLQPAENSTFAIKRIKQIGYSGTNHLILAEKDALLEYFSKNSATVIRDELQKQLENEEPFVTSKPGKNKTTPQVHALKKAVLKKLTDLDAAIAIPLYLAEQPIGLILLSEKLSGDFYSQEDLALLDTIGSAAISSIQKAKLYEGDQMKTEFVSIASHELLTPISAIEGYLSMILDENIGKVDPQAREYLTKVYSSSKRLASLIKDLLSVSRIESGRMKIEQQSLDISKMIQDTIDQLHFMAADKKLKLIYEKPSKPLPPVWADSDRTTQVLVNLTSNAIKYTPKGSITIKTHLVNEPTPMVKVEVTDTGMGMTKQAQSHLFEKFYRVDTPETTGIVGTGLGLYITKSIVELMGGKITVKSTPGEGSTFAITLPVFKVEASNVAA